MGGKGQRVRGRERRDVRAGDEFVTTSLSRRASSGVRDQLRAEVYLRQQSARLLDEKKK